MPLHVPIPKSEIAELSAEEVWRYVTRLLTSLATPDDIIKFLGKGLGTEVPVNKSLYDLIALDRLDHAIYGLSASKIGIQDDIGALDHHIHSRWRVYPQDITTTVQLTSGTPANTFGSWGLIVPINTVPFEFEIIGIVLDQVSVATTYHIQIGYNPINVIPGLNMEMGERRLRIATLPIARASELLAIHSQEMPANSSVWGRLKTASDNEETANISIVLSRHAEVEREVPLWPSFPW